MKRGVIIMAMLGARVASAGPPFVTDDPEPVEHEHWEIYLATQDQHDSGGWTGAAPQLEVNYGAIENLQLHLIAPLAYTRPTSGAHAYGVGDVELGAKYRFVDEDEASWRPQIGVFPLVELPTGSRERGLGDGHLQVFVPAWLQKSFGPWTTYGGGGFWVHPGAGHRNWVFVGLEVQRKLSSKLALGVEVFHGTSPADGVDAETRFNVGAMLDATDHHHILASAGSGLGGGFQGYLAYQLTFGPEP